MTGMKNDGMLVEFYFVTLVTNALVLCKTVLPLCFAWRVLCIFLVEAGLKFSCWFRASDACISKKHGMFCEVTLMALLSIAKINWV